MPKTRHLIALFLLTAFSSVPQSLGAELSLRDLFYQVEKTDPAFSAASARKTQAEEAVNISQAGYYPKIDIEAIESAGFPGSTSLLGIGGLMGSPYRSGIGYGITATIPLLDFGRTSHSVDVAMKGIQVEEANQKVLRIRVYQSAFETYVDCSRFRSLGDMWEHMAHEAVKIENEVSRFVRTGQRSVVDEYLAKTQSEEARTGVAEFRQRYETIRQRLAVITGLAEKVPTCPHLDDLTERGLDVLHEDAESPILTRAASQILVAQERIAEKIAGHYPKLVGLASIGGMEAARFVDSQNYAVGIGLVIPVFEGFKISSEVSQARAASLEKDFELLSSRQRVAEINLTYDENIISSRVKLQHLEDELTLAKQAYDLASKRYLSFQGTLVDVRDSLRNLQRVALDSNVVRAQLLLGVGQKKIVNGGHL